MPYLFKLARRNARLRALPLIALAAALSACDTDRLTNSSENLATPAAEPVTPPTALYAEGFRGGIPFGPWNMPTDEFGAVYNGSMRNIAPEELLRELAAIKSRGGRIFLTFAGNERHFIDGNHRFSLSMWKERVNRFKGINFDSYVQDGTLMGHYLIDEPNDAFNYGDPVPGSMVETMAQYSKQLWPGLATVVRAEPAYLERTGGPYRYLDAAWAQYVTRKGTADDYIRRNVADAQRIGLALVTGLNITKGGDGGTQMSASLVQSAGSTILAQSYPCAFLSWEWRDTYESRSDIKAAMAVLSNKAEAHAARSCRRSGDSEEPPPPPALPGITGISLKAAKVVQSGEQVVNLTWTGATGAYVRLFVNGDYRRNTVNDGKGSVYPQRSGTFSYRICEVGTTRCSNTVSVSIS
jgi:hypothetical protein